MASREAVITLRTKNPCFSTSKIADLVGISRERARQILASEKMATVSRKLTFNRTCPLCGGYKKPERKSCPSCREKEHEKKYIEVSCDVCGKLKKRMASKVVYQTSKRGYNHFFCDRTCLGKWVASKYGFKVHPEHVGKKRKDICIRGHNLLDNKITRKDKNGYKICRICEKIRYSKYYTKKLEKIENGKNNK